LHVVVPPWFHGNGPATRKVYPVCYSLASGSPEIKPNYTHRSKSE